MSVSIAKNERVIIFRIYLKSIKTKEEFGVMSYEGLKQNSKKESQQVQLKYFCQKQLITSLCDQFMPELIAILTDKNISGGLLADDEGNLVEIVS